MKREIHVGDIGTVIDVQVKDGNTVVDLQEATETQFLFGYPDHTSRMVTAALKTNGADGLLTYTSDENTFTMPGIMKLQAIVAFETRHWHTSIEVIRVHPNLDHDHEEPITD